MAAKPADCGFPSLGLSIDLSISVQQPHQNHHHHQQQQQQQQQNDFGFNNNNNSSSSSKNNKRGLSSDAEEEDSQTSLQLDLLPRPIVQKKNAGLLWQSLFSKSRAEAAAAAAAAATTTDSSNGTRDQSFPPELTRLWAVPVAEAPNSSICKGLDMNLNQIPCLAESDEAGAISTSIHLMEPSSSRLACPAKREREIVDEAASEQITSSRAASDEEEGGTRKKLRLSKEQSALLEESFREHSTLNPKQKNALAKQLNLRPRQVEVWFQNRRARTKLKQTEVDCELLKKYCEGLSEENRRLQKELHELRALKISSPCVITHDFYMPLPATTLTMCPSCERLAAVDTTNNANNNNLSSNNIINNNNNNINNLNKNIINKQPTATATSFLTTTTTNTRFAQPSLLQPV